MLRSERKRQTSCTLVRSRHVYVVSTLATLFISPAFAADLETSANDTRDKVAQTYRWTGVHLGANSGYGASLISGKGPLGSASGVLQGALAGAKLGYNYQIDTWVIGLEGDLAW